MVRRDDAAVATFERADAGSRAIATQPSDTTAHPRVLYLCFFFPPSRASGVFRGRATANHLAQAGWDVTVLTAPREFFSYHLSGASDESGTSGIGVETYCACPPWRCGGTTSRRATSAATPTPWSARTSSRHRSIPAAVPADVATAPSTT